MQSFQPQYLDTGLLLITNKAPLFQATVKNRGIRKIPICRDPQGRYGPINNILTTFRRQNGIPDACDGWTLPNVKCLVFDPLRIDAEIPKQPNANPYIPKKPECNPMKEINANSWDSLQFVANSFGTFDSGGDGRFFSYTGLEKFWFIPETFVCKDSDFPGVGICPIIRPNINNVPSQGKMTSYDLLQRVKSASQNSAFDPIFSLYGGLVAVFYDASKGIPEELDFERAQDGAMSNKILGSTVLLSTDCGQTGNLCQNLTLSQPQTVTVTTHVDELLTNPLGRDLQKVTKMSISIENSVVHNPAPKVEAGAGGTGFQLQIRFSSPLSTVSTQYVSISVLTTISIIFSTAATLWGSQEKIKDGIVLVKTKVEEYLTKKRKANMASQAEA